MRTLLLTSVAAFGLALAAPAMAQNTGTTPGTPTIPPPHKLMREGAMNPSTGARWGHTPGIGESLPMSAQASNIQPQDTRSIIAPSLPVPPIGDSANTAQFLNAARNALARHRTGEAQEALERAMTARLNGDALRGKSPTDDRVINQIQAALDALANHHFAMVDQHIADAMPGAGGGNMQTGPMEGTGMEGGAAMNMTGVGGPTAPYPDTGVYQAERHHTTIPGTQGVQPTPPGTQMTPPGSPS